MLQIFRRHATFLLIVALLVFVAFFWWGDPSRQGGVAGKVKLGKDSYSQKEIRDIRGGFQLSQDIGLQEHLVQVASLDRRTDDYQQDYTYNVLALRQNRGELGLSLSEEERLAAIAQVPAFRGLDGEGLNKILANRNRSLREVEDLVTDKVTLESLGDLVTSGIRPSSVVGDFAYRLRSETRTARAFLVKRADHLEGTTPSEEELKSYFETNRDDLLSGERRAIRYAFFPEPTVDELAKLATEEERVAADRAYKQRVNEYSTAVGEAGADFGSISGEREVALIAVPAFDEANPPAELPREVVREVFSVSESTPISKPLRAGGGYYVFELLDREEPRPLSFEEARERIVQTVTAQKVRTAMQSAADAAKTKLAEVLSADGDLLAAGTELGLESIDMGQYTLKERPADPRVATLAQASANLISREVSDPVPLGEDLALVCVERRELLADLDAGPAKESLIEQQTYMNRQLLLDAWVHQYKSDIVQRQVEGSEE